jgi:hypothetical protein
MIGIPMRGFLDCGDNEIGCNAVASPSQACLSEKVLAEALARLARSNDVVPGDGAWLSIRALLESGRRDAAPDLKPRGGPRSVLSISCLVKGSLIRVEAAAQRI